MLGPDEGVVDETCKSSQRQGAQNETIVDHKPSAVRQGCGAVVTPSLHHKVVEDLACTNGPTFALSEPFTELFPLACAWGWPRNDRHGNHQDLNSLLQGLHAGQRVDDVIHLIVRMEELTLDAEIQRKAENGHGVDVERDQEAQHVSCTHDTNGADVEGPLIQEVVVVERCLPHNLFGFWGGQELVAQVLKVAWCKDGVRVATRGCGATKIQVTVLLQARDRRTHGVVGIRAFASDLTTSSPLLGMLGHMETLKGPGIALLQLCSFLSHLRGPFLQTNHHNQTVSHCLSCEWIDGLADHFHGLLVAAHHHQVLQVLCQTPLLCRGSRDLVLPSLIHQPLHEKIGL